ncbi:hypothetical protein llap_12486 [Limosa lapponica baueri]|uniref:Uncharacterized protein n=1 Tax=Limosa lapponica baueri TaxID=1758121 RepID=A0A2I0TTS4_LIMLA|nr:hypothetical protein llap_12486 [Limosa lapponica baueri]
MAPSSPDLTEDLLCQHSQTYDRSLPVDPIKGIAFDENLNKLVKPVADPHRNQCGTWANKDWLSNKELEVSTASQTRNSQIQQDAFQTERREAA